MSSRFDAILAKVMSDMSIQDERHSRTSHEYFQPCPVEPCAGCTGNSAVRKRDGTFMTSWEWCQEMNACADTVDWDRIRELHER